MRGNVARGRTQRRLGTICLTAFVVGAVGLLTSHPSGAQAVSESLIGGGAADGLRVIVDIPGFLVVERVEVGAPTAQASIDTEGNSNAFAGLPYPGDVVANIGSVPSVLFATSIPFTPPGYVTAVSPVTPRVATSDPSGTYELLATAEPDDAHGKAALDPGSAAIASGARAESHATIDGEGGMTVVSESVASGIDIGGVLRIASIRSTSTTTYAAGDDEPVTENDFVIDGFTVLGVGVSLTADGLELAGQTIPLPLGDLVETLSAALEQAGISLRLIEEVPTTGGGASRALEIKVSQTIPIDGNPQGTVTYRIGGASSFIAVAPAFGSAAAPAAAGPAATLDAGLAGTGSPDLGLPSTPVSPGVVPTIDAPDLEPVLIARDLEDALRTFYLVLVIGGVLGVIGSALWGWKGARASWMVS